MPRTKVSKSSKRNRDAENREEKIRDFETSLDQFLSTFDSKVEEYVTEWEDHLRMLLQRTNSVLLQMKVGDMLDLNLGKFADYEQSKALFKAASNSTQSSICNTTSTSLLRSAKAVNPNDEGYLTEDSTTGGSMGSSTTNAAYLNMSHIRAQQQQQQQQQQTSRLRTPGPLNSARARRPRRSRSACGDYGPGSALKPKPSALSAQNTPSGATLTEHASRNKLRTPLANRTKAHSADRTAKLNHATSPQSPPTAFLRWPRPGELVLSKCGSPLVAQVLPDKFANVNIPMRNGVLSLRPKKLDDLKPDIFDAIDPETLDQLKTLHANLDKIVNFADKAILK